MQGRDGWQALQKHLAAARAAAANGDRELALAAVNAALEIDPEFLAAQTLRDRLLKNETAAARPRPAAPALSERVDLSPSPAPAPAPPRGVSPESYAKFQERAKQRRVETRIDAARDAIRRRSLSDAAAALDEVTELDPKHHDLAALTAQFHALHRRATAWHRGPWAAAAAAFIATTLGASYVQDSSWLMSRPFITAGVLMPGVEGSVLSDTDARRVGTSGEIPGIAAPAASTSDPGQRQPEAGRASSSPSTPSALAARPPELTERITMNLPAPQLAPQVSIAQPPATQAASSLPTSSQALAPQLSVAQLPALAPPPAAEAAAYVSAPAAIAPPARPQPAVDDSALVQNALQRYRRAYEQLDAQSAQAVWPAVNEAALARAFDGLASQTLTFDACNVRVIGDGATATCRGSARYVPKIGSRDPRVEPRVWNFTLKKKGSGWTIDSARAER